jgi:hypothetical protein
MNRILTASLIGTATAAALVVGTCAPALASTPTPSPTKAPQTLSAVQAKAKTAINDRLGKLSTAIAKETSAKGVSSTDRSTLLGRLNSDVSGLKSLEGKIAADTTLTTASADLKSVFTTYRVYSVAIPQAHVVSAADRATSTAIPRLTAAESKLSAALKGKDSSKSTAALQADLTDMSAQISAATNALKGVSSDALAVTPSSFNSNHSVLKSIRANAKTARADLKKAVSDGKTVRAALK